MRYNRWSSINRIQLNLNFSSIRFLSSASGSFSSYSSYFSSVQSLTLLKNSRYPSEWKQQIFHYIQRNTNFLLYTPSNTRYFSQFQKTVIRRTSSCVWTSEQQTRLQLKQKKSASKFSSFFLRFVSLNPAMMVWVSDYDKPNTVNYALTIIFHRKSIESKEK